MKKLALGLLEAILCLIQLRFDSFGPGTRARRIFARWLFHVFVHFCGVGTMFPATTLFSKALPCFSLVYTIGAPRGWEGKRKKFFFVRKAHHPIVGPFSSCSILVRPMRAREKIFQKMALFFVILKITSEIKIVKKSRLLISLKV